MLFALTLLTALILNRNFYILIYLKSLDFIEVCKNFWY